MPYIRPENRKAYDVGLEKLKVAVTPGELNYLFTRLAYDYIDYNGKNYQSINDAIGALECAKQELYRRVAVPYENIKWYENGDVYESR